MGATAAVAGGISAAGNAYAQSQSAKAQGEVQKRMLDMNARIANLQAEDAIRRGDKDAKETKRQTKRLIGSQRAALAAQGIDIEDGSALEVQMDTAALGELNALNIRNNAWREAWGYRVAASDLNFRGNMAYVAGRNEARNTLLAGGMQTIGYGARAAGAYEGSSLQKGFGGRK